MALYGEDKGTFITWHLKTAFLGIYDIRYIMDPSHVFRPSRDVGTADGILQSEDVRAIFWKTSYTCNLETGCFKPFL